MSFAAVRPATMRMSGLMPARSALLASNLKWQTRPLAFAPQYLLSTSTRSTSQPSISRIKPLALAPFRRNASNAPSLFARDIPQAYSTAWWQRLLVTGGVVAAGTVGINFLLNRETREAFSPFEREYLHSTFQYMGSGLAVVAAGAFAMHKNGLSYRLMQASPWAVVGVSLIGGIGSMMGVFYTDPANSVQKHLCFAAFQGFQALTLAPLFFLHPALLGRAALYTAGIFGSLSYIGATARSDQYLYLGGPLMCGLVVVALSSLAPLVLPATAIGTLAFTESISLYGGLAVFSGFTLYDTQKVLARAKLAQQGAITPDPMAESISLELDFINLFIRMVSILAGQNNRRR